MDIFREKSVEAYSMEILGIGYIRRAILEAIALSETMGRPVTFTWPGWENPVTIIVNSDSSLALIYRDWERIYDGCIPNQGVGPYPKPVLSLEEQTHDAHVRAEKAQRYREARAKEMQQRATLEARIGQLPPMAVVDRAAWERLMRNHEDIFGQMIIGFAIRWARLMQTQLDRGRALEEVALQTIDEADVRNVADAGLCHAVPILAQHWIHGPALLAWYTRA